jgi:hypothetical protein
MLPSSPDRPITGGTQLQRSTRAQEAHCDGEVRAQML